MVELWLHRTRLILQVSCYTATVTKPPAISRFESITSKTDFPMVDHRAIRSFSTRPYHGTWHRSREVQSTRLAPQHPAHPLSLLRWTSIRRINTLTTSVPTQVPTPPDCHLSHPPTPSGRPGVSANELLSPKFMLERSIKVSTAQALRPKKKAVQDQALESTMEPGQGYSLRFKIMNSAKKRS